MIKKIRILYVISTLEACGPVNVLYNIVENLDLGVFEPYILTLSKARKNDRTKEFLLLGSEVDSLNISRVNMLLRGSKYIIEKIKKYSPDIIHTQCFRSTVHIANICLQYKKCVTIHNYPHEDYVFTYGKILGTVMYFQYFRAIKKYDEIIACSKSISVSLERYNIYSKYIRNGINLKYKNDISIENKVKMKKKLDLPDNKKIFVVVGVLSRRKNQELIIRNFKKFTYKDSSVLIFLGDGDRNILCKNVLNDNVIFKGNVKNVEEYLSVADIFISASLAEGMPNAVLEALCKGIPVLLSDIEPHKEIMELNNDIGRLFKSNDADDFLYNLSMLYRENNSEVSYNTKNLIMTCFNSIDMSKEYQNVYINLYKSK